MQLAQLLKPVPGIRQITGNPDMSIRSIQADSRLVQPGDLFVALRGAVIDGHHFLQQALEKGAVALMVDTGFEAFLPADTNPIALIRVEDTAEALGYVASAFYNDPSRQLKLIAVTGTNGKTTVTTLLWQCFSRLGFKCGLIGTVENRVGNQIFPSTHTTPDALRLQALLAKMVEAGCAYVFIETSSHAVHQRRIAACHFDGAVFTNLTHDHLDYHGTFAEYRDAKKRLFDELEPGAFALTNVDDKNGQFMLQNTKARKLGYALKKSAEYKAKILDNALTGLHLQLDDAEVHARLIGTFNAYNLLAVYGVARELGIESTDALTAISDLPGAEGRFERVVVNERIGITDYAHTPDALEQVLDTILQLKKKNTKVITVVGCGGDRDTTKRPVMGKIAANLSDQVIFTSDNPRTEDPMAILKDMEAGLESALAQKVVVIEQREQAIKTAARMSQKGDIVLVAGKGHEKYQEIKGVKHPFDDKAMLLRYLAET